MSSSRRWSLADVPLDAIALDRVRARDDLFVLVCSASFVESGSDTYTRTLIEHFDDDAEVGAWLRDAWEREELQHGRALRAYLLRVWPEFDWDSAYADFFAEYAQLCTRAELEPTRGQELVARCIVEMGTTTYYQALSTVCDEPVLQALAARIRADEVGHYKHFYRYFLRYRDTEHLDRGDVVAALWRRVAELRHSDAEIALRHVTAWHQRTYPGSAAGGALAREAVARMRQVYPADLAVRMALKPLRLGPRTQRWVQRPLTALTRRVLLG